MTNKVTMPEPVAYYYENPYSKKLTLNWRKSPAPGVFTPLVTEGQAEAYAEARVSGALEEAARLCDTLDNKGNCDEYRGAARHSALRIRALIPKEPP